jgi:C-terminal processing protease CtpA/Prc
MIVAHQPRAPARAAAAAPARRAPRSIGSAAPLLSRGSGLGSSRVCRARSSSSSSSSDTKQDEEEATPLAEFARRFASVAAAAIITLAPAPGAGLFSLDSAAPAHATASVAPATPTPTTDDTPPQEFVRLPASTDPAIFEAQRSLAEAWQIVGETFFDGRALADWPQELRAHMEAAFSSASADEAYARGVDALLADLGDPYTRRVPPEEYASFRVTSEGALQGVGLLLATGEGNSGAPPPFGIGPSAAPSFKLSAASNAAAPAPTLLPRLTVLAPVRGGPADRAGVLPGDEVVAIEGQPTDGWTGEQAARILRGAGGTEVRVRFARAYNPGDEEQQVIPGVPARSPPPLADGSNGKANRRALLDPTSSSSSATTTPPPAVAYRTFDVRLRRERVELSPVVSALLRSPRNGLPIGYVRLASFSQNAAEELRRAMADLDARALASAAWLPAGSAAGGAASSASSSGASASAAALAASPAGGAGGAAAGAGGLAGYVLDLRGNGGGLVRAGIEVAAAFLPGSPTVFQVSGRDGEQASRVVLPPPESETEAAARWFGSNNKAAAAAAMPPRAAAATATAPQPSPVAWRETPTASPLPPDADADAEAGGPLPPTARRPRPADATTPLVVLVDEGTASASEILTGALRDNRRLAAVVGDSAHTYGKGRIQSVFEMRDGSALFVTVARYRTPKGGEIDQVGIAPDRRCLRPAVGGGAMGGGRGGVAGRPLRVRSGGEVVVDLSDSSAASGSSSSSSSRRFNPLAVMAGGGAVSRRDEAAAARQIEADGCVLAATRLLESGDGNGARRGAVASAGEAARLAAARLAAARLPPIGVLGAQLHAEAPPLHAE